MKNYIGSHRLLLMALTLLMVSSAIQAEVMVNLNTPQNKVRTFRAKLDPVIQGYFKAVVAGDKKALLSYYDLTYIGAYHMGTVQKSSQAVMALLDQQIKANGGLRKVDLVGFFGDSMSARVILELEFANGFKDISGGIKVKSQGYGDKADWKFVIETGGHFGSDYPGLAVAGLRAATKTLDGYYTAVQAGDYAALRKLTYNDYWLEKQPANRQPAKQGSLASWGDAFVSSEDYGTPEQRLEKRFTKHIEEIQTLIKANGGIKHIEVSKLDASEGKLFDYHKKGGNDKNYKRLSSIELTYDVHYSNGKAEYDKRFLFVLDDKGQWKIAFFEPAYL